VTVTLRAFSALPSHPFNPFISDPYKQLAGGSRCSIEWAPDTEWSTVENVRVDRRRGYDAVLAYLLDGGDVVAGLEEMGRPIRVGVARPPL
jgi:hypothetical protein